MSSERKRGDQLEIAILEAADEIIQTLGYEKMTFQNVAKQANTSRTVIYRRYETPVDLLHGLVQYKSKQILGGKMMDLFEEKESLRADLIAVMEIFQKIVEAIGPKVLSALLFELRQRNESLQLWLNEAQESNMKLMKKIQDSAINRGEIKHEFSKIQMILPFNLLRLENVLSGGNVTRAYIVQLVDEVLMPVYLS